MATVREQKGQDFYDHRKSKKKSPLRLNREKLEQQSILVGKGVMSWQNPTHAVWHSSDQILIDSVRDHTMSVSFFSNTWF